MTFLLRSSGTARILWEVKGGVAMSLTLAIAAMSLLQGPSAHNPSVDVAFEELAAAQNDAAIARIEGNADLDLDDPARQINLAIAYARKGRIGEARRLLASAAHNADRVQLETASGEWIDSRRLAMKALSLMKSGQLGGVSRVASR